MFWKKHRGLQTLGGLLVELGFLRWRAEQCQGETLCAGAILEQLLAHLLQEAQQLGEAWFPVLQLMHSDFARA